MSLVFGFNGNLFVYVTNHGYILFWRTKFDGAHEGNTGNA